MAPRFRQSLAAARGSRIAGCFIPHICECVVIQRVGGDMQDEVETRDWSGVDGATAWHLIDRHANNWTDVGEMMNAWLASN